MMVSTVFEQDAPKNDGGSNDYGTIERGARWIASLDHPFYDDERQRHIWYEASSIGLQLFIQLQLAVAVAAVWIGGDTTAVAYTAGFLGVLGVVSMSTLAYTKSKHAEYLPTSSDYSKGPVVLYLLLVAAYGAGTLRAVQPDGSTDLSTIAGFIVGMLAAAGLGAFIGFTVIRRRARNAEE